ncbi:hypothetical protein ATZ36_17800 [Candidatus Endomicrobiellum trichonymphae]|jgi:hypothetical protein|uniref:Uncharacterized protein n=1 Tax=Endomicrobium trichonymphae TaxID=1408204 RepID=A0A1E5IJY7_ENDTX|nr:hypothetical protein ATZ36_17800 [Candidatus Endomicrobium trichonymphae]
MLLDILLCSDGDIFTYPLPCLPEFMLCETKTPFFYKFQDLSLNSQKVLSGCVLRLWFYAPSPPVKKKISFSALCLLPKYLAVRSVVVFVNSDSDAYVFL